MSDLIIEGAKGLPDGLYMKKDGLLFKYKPNGGTVYTARAYHVTERPKGKWIDAMAGEMPIQACDQCNTFFPLAYTGGGHNFCPNCGADMRGEDE